MSSPDELSVLRNNNLVLRAWRAADLPVLQEASLDPYIPATTSVPSQYTDADAQGWLARQGQIVDEGRGYPLAIVDPASNTAMGFIGLYLHAGRVASVGYWIVPSARGKGLASRALTLLADWAFEHLGLVRLELHIEPWNAASVRAAEHAGFHHEGLLRAFREVAGQQRDVLVYTRVSIGPLMS